jgi:formiminoglutamase
VIRLRPSEVQAPSTRADDPRIGQLLGSALSNDAPARVSLVGFCVDQGVVRNGGREGARLGPDEIRRELFRMCPDARRFDAFCTLVAHTRDLGNLHGSHDLLEDQRALGAIVARELARGTFVVVLGGGHETAYGHFLGYVGARLPLHIQNVDAHADVRPLIDDLGHSGSPFRQALEHPSRILRSYRVDGLQPNRVARSHLDYIARHGGHARFRDEFDAEALFAPRGDATMATFCLDAVDAAHAPGVSAPSTNGLSPQEWLAAARRAGRCPSVRSVDVVELCPRLDRDRQTAMLAARTVWETLLGLCERAC